MKYLCSLLFACLAFSATLSAQFEDDINDGNDETYKVVKQETVEGFRGMTWGVTRRNARINGQPVELQFSEKVGDKSYYIRPAENNSIGTAEMDLIYYVFDKDGRFESFIMEGKPGGLEDMMFILENKFGKHNKVQTASTYRGLIWYLKGAEVKLYMMANDDYRVKITGFPDGGNSRLINSRVSDF